MKKILTIVILFTISFSYLLITTRSVLAVPGIWTCLCNSGFSQTFNGDSGDPSIRSVQCTNFCVANNNGGIRTCTFREIVTDNNGTTGAQNNGTSGTTNTGSSGTTNTGSSQNPSGTQTSKLDNPLSTSFGSTIPQITAKIIKIFLGLIGTISFVMFIYGGFLIFTAMGNASKAKTGMNTLVYASLGILVVFTSYAMLKFVLSIFNLS